MLKYILVWFSMIVLAVLNGALRDLWYRNIIGELRAHQLSTIVLVLVFFIYIMVLFSYIPPASQKQSIFIGILWLVLTLAFEFGFGLMRGRSMSELLKDYDIIQGRIWILIPLWVSLLPWVVFRIRH